MGGYQSSLILFKYLAKQPSEGEGYELKNGYKSGEYVYKNSSEYLHFRILLILFYNLRIL